jgi:putative intracellular protease/amidase
MLKKILIAAGAILSLVVLLVLALPTIGHSLGIHPVYEDARDYSLPGKRALLITTSHGVLNAPGETGGDPTGVMASEFTIAYYQFLDAGMEVEISSIKGGEIPIDPQTLNRVIRSPEDERFLQDPVAQAKANNSLKIDDLDFTRYDVVWIAGGWGAAYDLGYSDVLGQKVSEAYYGEKETVFGSVCHGALGFIRARDRDGKLLIAGRKITGVSDKQVKELGIEVTPLHPETELRKAGGIYSKQERFMDFFATSTVVDDEKRFVTGQNQNSSHETAQNIMAILDQRVK